MKNQFKSPSDKKSTARKEPKSTSKKLNFKPFEKLKERINSFIANERTQNITGLSFLLISIYMLIAFSSFIFTGRADYNEIYEKSFFDFLFDSSIEVENWLGNLGAMTSHIFMYSWFGIASFLFVMLTFLIGIRILFKTSLLPLKKTFKYTAFSIVWISVALGYIFYNTEFKALYGAFGYHINTWLFRVIGYAGTGLMVVFSMLIFLIYSFNLSFKSSKKVVDEDENKESDNDEPVVPDATSTIKEVVEGEMQERNN